MPDDETTDSPAALARAELAQAKANVCPCGVRPASCPKHSPEEDA